MAGNSGGDVPAGDLRHPAATEPGRDGREQPGRADGAVLPGQAATEPGRDGREQSAAPTRPPHRGSRYGARPGWPGTVRLGASTPPGQHAATEPGRDGREQQADEVEHPAGEDAATEPGRDGREQTPPTGTCGCPRRTRRYGARPGWPGPGRGAPLRDRARRGRYGARPGWPGTAARTGRSSPPTRPLRSPAGMAGNSAGHRTSPGRGRAATEPGRDGREQRVRTSAPMAQFRPLRSPAGMAGNSTRDMLRSR